MKFMLLISIWFISSTHPISMIMMMIMMTMYINIILYKIMKHTWFPLIITLLMLGGLLVIFLYITSLTPNKKFIFKKKIFFFSLPLLFLFKMNNVLLYSNFNIQIYNIFTSSSMYTMIFMLLYLLITLIAIMMIIKSSLAPLKSN
uniref:NADH dehydrogenase subunit 6 n=1 Tax=Ornithodoros improvisus TaxID=2952141 RepID=UPI00286BBD4D|nr:NADH dehydrogenase subunit 6 [Ornithodoros improvisus]WKW52637.1 NADH dehydrogenase subunit 6 [Ornithodoros improvisus]